MGTLRVALRFGGLATCLLMLLQAASAQQTYRAGTPERSVTLGDEDRSDAGPDAADQVEIPPRVSEEILDRERCVKREVFERQWRIYSGFDARVEPQSRSHPVQQWSRVQREIVREQLEVERLEMLLELGERTRRDLCKQREKVVEGLSRNLYRAFWRLVWLTKESAPRDVIGKPISDSIFPTAELTLEELEILADQRVSRDVLDRMLQASEQQALILQPRAAEIRRKIGELQDEARGWEQKEKERVWALLNRDCQRGGGLSAERNESAALPDSASTPAPHDSKPVRLRARSFRLADVLVRPDPYPRPRELIQIDASSLSARTKDGTDQRPIFLHEMELHWNQPPAELRPGEVTRLTITGAVRKVATERRQPIGFGHRADWKAGTAEWDADKNEWMWRVGRGFPSPSPEPYQLGTFRGRKAIYQYTAPGDGYHKQETPGERFIETPREFRWQGKRQDKMYVYIMLHCDYVGDVVWLYEAQPELLSD